MGGGGGRGREEEREREREEERGREETHRFLGSFSGAKKKHSSFSPL
jgi:hypothetical protein